MADINIATSGTDLTLTTGMVNIPGCTVAVPGGSGNAVAENAHTSILIAG